MALTEERLRELLDYDPETGIFIWRATGAVAGSETHGYLRIVIDGKHYYAHRLAVLYMKGHWPPNLADHWNLNGLDNRWGNIREATKGQNAANSRAWKTNKLRTKGVSLCRATGKYRADIRINGKGRNLGRFGSIDEAYAAYDAAAKELFGEFARC